MRWTMARLLCSMLLLMAGCAGPGVAAAAAEVTPVTLRDAVPQIDASDRVGIWIDPRGDASIAQAARATYRPTRPGEVFDNPPQAALWMHLRLARGAAERQNWLLKFTMPLLDRVTVYQRELGGWREESAGDTLPVRRWPEAGRYPMFRLNVPAGETQDVYIRIRHALPAQFPLELVTAAHQNAHVQLEYLGLGAAFGALLLLIAGCLAKSWAYRDPVFAWYAFYAALTSLAVAAFTGVAPHLLWPGFGLLQDAPTPMLACAAVGAALLFIRNTLGLRRRLPLQDRLMCWLGLFGLAVALVPALTPKAVHLPLVAAYMLAGTTVALLVAVHAWWRGDNVGRWLVMAQLPMAVSVVAAVFRALGWFILPTVSQYLVVGALMFEVPMLLVALFIRSRDRHSAQVREQALSTHDALTGLLAPHLFSDRLRQVVARHRRDGENAAVMYISLVNHPRIRDVFGAAVAEQSLLRSVIKLRRLLRDVDTVSRVGEARFGVILEGATSRTSVTERATRLIAAGLMPLPGLKPDVTLQFHVAALLLSERPLEAEEIEAALTGQLAHMSPRTRRPIRFIQPEQDVASDPAPQDSVLFNTDLERASTNSAFAPAP